MKISILVLIFSLIPLGALSHNTWNKMYIQSNKYFRRQVRNNCAACHLVPEGPGTAFRQAFNDAGKVVTDELKAQFPDVLRQEGYPAPRILKVSPRVINTSQSTTVRILHNANFLDDGVVLFDGENIADSDVLGINPDLTGNVITLTFNTPKLTPGMHTLQLLNPTFQASNEITVRAK